MNNAEKHEIRTSPPSPLLYGLILLLSVLMLAVLFACGRTEKPVTNEETGTQSCNTEASTTGSEPESTAPEASTDRTDESKTLAYYVSLVEELQEEIRALKAENFILTSALQATTEPDESVSADQTPSFTYEIDDGEVKILSYTGKETEVTIPETIEGYPVTEIEENAFLEKGIVSVRLPDTLKEIDWFAFSGCSALKFVYVGAALSDIGYGAFDGCPATLTFVCPKGSYAERYAKSFGIAVQNT